MWRVPSRPDGRRVSASPGNHRASNKIPDGLPEAAHDPADQEVEVLEVQATPVAKLGTVGNLDGAVVADGDAQVSRKRCIAGTD